MTLLHSTSGLQAHLILEAAAYLLGGRVYWFQARRAPGPASRSDRWRLLACVLFGAALGSKALHALEHLAFYVGASDRWAFLGGKSILGGLIGGTLGAEAGKRWIGWPASTGDAWVPALAVGLVVGRAGCQLSGLWDGTFGIPTRLPWGWDYGDGVPRHPVAAYEMVAVAICWVLVHAVPAQPPGARFAAFLAGYCLIRLGLEWVKPPFGGDAASGLPVTVLGGLTPIQWAAVLGFLSYARLYAHRRQPLRPMRH